MKTTASLFVRCCPPLCALGLLTALPVSTFAQTVTTWNGGPGNWSTPTLWSNGVPDAGTADVFVDGGKATASAVTIDGSYTVGRLTISAGDSVTLDNAQTFTVASGGFSGAGVINNAGGFVVGSTGSYTALNFVGTTSLNGAGTLTLANATFLRGSGTFTNNSTIQGENASGGSLGFNELNLVNGTGGLINANVSGKTLFVDPAGGAGLVNNGALRASNGGILQLSGSGGGAFTNTNGTITAQTGSRVDLLDGASVTGGTLATTGTGLLQVDGSGATLSGLTLTGNLAVTNASALNLSGTITNNGTISVNSTSSYTAVTLDSSTTLAGTGTFTLANATFVRGTGTLTNTAGHTIQGENALGGSLGYNEIAIANQGLIDANVSGRALFMDPSGTGLTNNGGTLRASNGGVLQLSGNGGGNFNNTNGTISALAGSEVQWLDGATVTGGTLSATGTGLFRNVSGATLGGTMTLTGALAADNATITTLAAGTNLTNNGAISFNSTSSYTALVLSGNATLAGTGTVTVANDTFVRGTGRLTNNQTIQGENALGGSLGYNEISFTNNGTVLANVAGKALLVDPSAVANAFVNSATGTVAASGGGIATLSGNSGGSFTNNGVFRVSGGNSRLNVDAGALTNFSGTTLTGGAYYVLGSPAAPATTLSLGGGNLNTNNADVRLSGAGAVFTEINGLANNQGTFAIANGRNFTAAGALSSPGTLIVSGGSTLTVNGALTQSSAGTLMGDGALTAAGFSLFGVIAPGGNVDAATGSFSPGGGALTLTGSTAFGASTRLAFELGMAGSATNDQLQVGGALTLDGTLNVTAFAGFGAGRYDLLTYTGTLTDNGLQPGTLPIGYNYSIDASVTGRVTLVVTNVPEPSTWVATFLGGSILCIGLRRRRGLRP